MQTRNRIILPAVFILISIVFYGCGGGGAVQTKTIVTEADIQAKQEND